SPRAPASPPPSRHPGQGRARQAPRLPACAPPPSPSLSLLPKQSSSCCPYFKEVSARVNAADVAGKHVETAALRSGALRETQAQNTFSTDTHFHDARRPVLPVRDRRRRPLEGAAPGGRPCRARPAGGV